MEQRHLSEASYLRAAQIHVHLSVARCRWQVARHGANGVWRAANFSYIVADVAGMKWQLVALRCSSVYLTSSAYSAAGNGNTITDMHDCRRRLCLCNSVPIVFNQ